MTPRSHRGQCAGIGVAQPRDGLSIPHHGQACIDLGEGIVVEGVAEDGTIEAISMPSAPGYLLGVQWHAEYEPVVDDVSARIFGAFGEAARTWRVKKAA